MRILIAEDEQRARRGLKSLISSISEKYEIVSEAADGKQALELMGILKPDVVLTDLKMPRMGGMELIRTAQVEGIQAKYVIISAYEEFEAARQAISLGVSDYLVKPITYEEVKELLLRLEQDNFTGEEKGRYQDLKEQYPNAHPLVLKALRYIEKEYASKISQKALAEDLGISQEYLCYIFNKDIGENFSKFLKNYRIESAKKLLDTGGIPKEEVAYSVGFSDVKYFNKCFRELVGMSVSDYIRNRK